MEVAFGMLLKRLSEKRHDGAFPKIRFLRNRALRAAISKTWSLSVGARRVGLKVRVHHAR